jgi:hypothetical protein
MDTALLIYCADYQCSHWPDDVRLSDLEPLACVRGLRT